MSDRNLVRAVLLTKNQKEYIVGLLCQDVAAAADASQAGERLRLTVGKGDSLEAAFCEAEQLLFQSADYKLCEYVIVCGQPDQVVLQQYLDMVITSNTRGKLSAYLCAWGQDVTQFEQGASDESTSFTEWLEILQSNKLQCARMYNVQEAAVLIPCLSYDGDQGLKKGSGAWLLGREKAAGLLDENTAQMLYLLTRRGKEHRFLLQGKQMDIAVQTFCFEKEPLSGEIKGVVYIKSASPLRREAVVAQLNALASEIMNAYSAELSSLLWLEGFCAMAGDDSDCAQKIEVEFRPLFGGACG